MRIPGSTKRDIEENFFLATVWVTGALMLVGFVLWLSVKYVSLGSELIILGAGVGVLGWLLAKVLPLLFKYKEIICPSCSTSHKVTGQAGVLICENCGRRLFGAQFWRMGKNKTERERLNEQETAASAREKALRKRA